MDVLMYKPSQYLTNYQYDRSVGPVVIFDLITVKLQYGEILVPRFKDPVIPKGSNETTLEYDVVRDQFVANTNYPFEDKVLITILDKILYRGTTPNNDPSVIGDLRAQISDRCKPDTRFYVRVIIHNPYGEGGQGTATIQKDDKIVII